jgi:hypothetical protein
MAPKAYPPAKADRQAAFAGGTRLLSVRFVIGIPLRAIYPGAASMVSAASVIICGLFFPRTVATSQQRGANAAQSYLSITTTRPDDSALVFA